MKWEYKAVRLNNPSFNELSESERLTMGLDEYGNHGWELISFNLDKDCAVFKRPKTLNSINEIRIKEWKSASPQERMKSILSRGEITLD